MRLIIISLFILFSILSFTKVKAGSLVSPVKQYYELRIYHAANPQQLASLDQYLQFALLPALHRHGVVKAGVFKWSANDTASDKRVYVLIPHKSLERFENLHLELEKDKGLEEAGKDYVNSTFDKPPFTRYETILLRAFEEMPSLAAPNLASPKSQRVYELRSYEGPTEKYYKSKVKMFNQGGEVKLFKRLGFNAVFYAEVLSGSRMPNLMYMTTFENKAERDEHWKSFGSDPEWKTLSALPEYQHNVSKSDILFLTPANYSDL